MDSISAVDKELDKVTNKFSSISDHSQRTLSDLILQLQNLQRDLIVLSSELHLPITHQNVIASNQCQLSGIQKVILNQNIQKVRDIISQIASEHREIHASVSRVGKMIDKNFTADFDAVGNEAFLDDPSKVQIINQVIVEHFLRQGMLEIAEELIHESKLDIPPEKKNPFTELNSILDALKRKDLQPALEWAKSHREWLNEQNSLLEFKLHRLQFVELLSQGIEKQSELIAYARANFQVLAERHENEIQSLMGSLLYLKMGIESSPYSHFLDPINWNEICEVFTRDACALLGLSVDSPLSVTFNAGCHALPALLNIKQVITQRQVTAVWNTKDELPIEIDLGKKCHFHSIFACPILRQQGSENNPPMRLVCGHVISRDALTKLTKDNKLKCPYCPVEQNPQDARQVFF
ncbi:Protein RMD5-like protein [Leptotrombidium deliense]|uniref:Protein RMD5-like protein n=1 Tax=Leptotrombidium deliense TaxID=299467 RepID=A0A443SLJ0_9ACAR|nr:Protein RMD5-like protein [Leptotrombidium deliense]